MLLIYTHKITSRFSYIMRHVFTRILGVEVTFTTKVEDFIKHSGPKITYSKQPLQNEFFIRSNDLLFEQGINDLDINISNWDEEPCFFIAGERSNIPFDIFSASFYLLSRYEEYLPHVKDMHGRFSPHDSLTYGKQILRKPLVDIWAFKLLDALKEKFPELVYKERSFKYTSVVDVTTSHCYAYKGLVRNFFGFIMDLGTFKLRRVIKRVGVWFNPSKDPYNNFLKLIGLHKTYTINSIFFFQFAAYSTYDKNVSIHNNKFKFLIKSIADYSRVALSASYSSFDNVELLKKEKNDLSNVLNRKVSYSRMRYNRVDIPVTYRNLVEAEITDDFTMGYTHEIGFRAGTCTPFNLYDITMELQQPIKVHPFAVHDYALRKLSSKEEIIEKVKAIYKEVKAVEGEFVTVFSNELLGTEHVVDWKKLYETIIKEFNA